MKVSWWEILAAGIAGALVVLPLRSGRAQAADSALPEWRRVMLECIREHARLGTLYQWGGGHGWRDPEYGLDCSGLALHCAKRAGIELYMVANDMYQKLPEVYVPQPGDLALYGSPQHANHVRVVEAWYPDEGRAATIGAEGGGSKVNDPVKAEQIDARVRRIDDHRGKYFLGFRTFDGYNGRAQLKHVGWKGAG